MNNTDIWLAHHGIKGQKWGIRRFQNPDGSYTEAGLKRINRKTRRIDKKISKINAMEKYDLENREKSRKSTESRYDEYIEFYKNDKKTVEDLKKQKDEYLKDFDLGTKSFKEGYDAYRSIYNKYKNVTISALEDKEYKKSPEYKAALQAYRDADFYSMRYASLKYISEAAMRNESLKKDNNTYSVATGKGSTEHYKNKAPRK